MKPISERRSDRKRRALLAATEVFLEKGYDCTSMDEVTAKAAISKPTLYKYFFDKERLFAEIVRDSSGEIDDLVRLAAEWMAGKRSVESGLIVLARRVISTLTQPRRLRLRRLVVANAERFPDVGRDWYEQGFERVLATLAISLQSLADRKLLRVNDPLLAANHFIGMLLWVPIDRAMFTGDSNSSPEELERYAVAAVRAFLAGYGPTT
ncbi:MAG TPA: TetR/AcrR family transcriptional regulator [Terracidiphilus sp.]|nr:TetR/AcrR family transcriptional regulator [Terracidiphilus sp.]